MPDSDAYLLFTTCPDEASAALIARQLVDERLAACVQRGAAVTSVYRWQGQVHEDREVPLQVKTSGDRLQAAIARIVALHPYELPECIAVHADAGLPAYMDWIRAQTREDTD